MPESVLVDTGPIIAILSQRDQHHKRCVLQLGDLRPPLFTCWPVLTEAQWLLRGDPRAVAGLFQAFATGLLSLLPVGEEALPDLEAFLQRYSKIQPDLADAMLIYLAEREGTRTIFSLDQRDFTVYRLKSGRRLNIVPDPAN